MKSKSLGPILVTVFVFGALFWVLWILGENMNADPKLDSGGKVISDVYQRSKDLFTVVVSLATATLGYWYGSDGKAEAQDQAAKSQIQASQVQEQMKAIQGEMIKAHEQKAAVLAAGDPDLLNKARQLRPEAFV